MFIQIISAVNDKTALCLDLLEIVAQRVVMLMSQPINKYSPSLPPNVAMWLQSLVSKNFKSNVPILTWLNHILESGC